MISLMTAVVLLSIHAFGQETETGCYCVRPDSDTSHSECHLLSYYVRNQAVLHNGSYFSFLPGDYQLSSVWNLSSDFTLFNLSLVASRNESCNDPSDRNASAFVTCYSNQSGLVITKVIGLTIMGIGFSNCGHTYNNPELKLNIASSLLLVFVWDLHISGVHINDSNGWGMFCYTLLGDSHITYTFISGGHHIGNYSGGNIRLKFFGEYYDSTNDTHNITVSHSTIQDGTENGTNSDEYAGGLDIYLITTSKINVTLDHVTFVNNRGYDGGNIAISYTTRDGDWTSTVTFKNCRILAGVAANSGGGIHMEAIQHSNSSIVNSSDSTKYILTVLNTDFSNNQATHAGGGVHMVIHESEYLRTMAQIHFESCDFTNNTATTAQSGTAVHVVNFHLPGSVPHRVPQYKVSFENSSFKENGGNKNSEQLLGCGTIYIAENALTVMENLDLFNNSCSGIVAIQSTLVMNSNITIANNTAYNGGGIMLCANSIMFLLSEAYVLIQDNNAKNFGGGIYAEFECSQYVPPCFYGTEENRTSVHLVNNKAHSAGDALYGGIIDHCYTAPNSYLKIAFRDIFRIEHNFPTNTDITSDPYKVCFCTSNSSGYNTSDCRTTHAVETVYPGMTITVYVVVVGQRNGTVPGVVEASFSNNDFLFNNTENSQNVEEECHKLQYTILRNNWTQKESNEQIHLLVENAYFRTRSPNQLMNSTINLTVRPCPHGFELKDQQCKCSARLHLKGIKCNIQSQTVTRNENLDWWLGFDDNETIIYSAYCSFDFCQNSKKLTISLEHDTHSPNQQCAFKREGKLCGRCSSNRSNALGSSMCEDCSNANPGVTFALTLLFAVIGVMLLIFLGILNMNVTEGTLNAIIFYMNIVRINDSIYFGFCEKGDKCSQTFLRVFVAWMNLDLEIDTCYYDGMTPLGKTALQFVFPFYLLFLCTLFIYFSRHFPLVSRIAGKQSVRLLATIILLSYAKILRAIIDIVWPATLSKINGHETVIHHETVWKMNGNVPYFRRDHMILSIFAAIVAVCTLPYTLSLLFIQWLKKVSHYRVLFWVVKLKPFFDAYTGPYKDRYQFWTGFLLVIRICLFIALTTNTTKGPMLNLTLVCVTAAILSLLSQPGVYKSWPLSIMESFVYFNLILFSIGTAFVFQQNTTAHNGESQNFNNDGVIFVCVGSMLILFCGVTVFNFFKMFRGTQFWGRLKIWLQEKHWLWKKRKPIGSLVLQHSLSDSSSSSSDDELDPILRNAPPLAKYDQLREPLVETS